MLSGPFLKKVNKIWLTLILTNIFLNLIYPFRKYKNHPKIDTKPQNCS